MKKIIKIKEDFKLPDTDIILEKGDKIKLLTELFDSPYEFKKVKDDGYHSIYKALTDKNSILSVIFDNRGKTGFIDLKFFIDEGWELTGKGDQFRILSTVLSIVKSYLQENTIKMIYFTAKERSRKSLYKIASKKLFKMFRFKDYLIINPSKFKGVDFHAILDSDKVANLCAEKNDEAWIFRSIIVEHIEHTDTEIYCLLNIDVPEYLKELLNR